MNWPAIIVWLIGIPIAVWVDLRHDPLPRYADRGLNPKSPAEVGFEISMIALMWPIILPFFLAYHLFRLIGLALGAGRSS